MKKKTFYIALLSMAIIALFSACAFTTRAGNTEIIRGTGEIVSRTFEVNDFTGLNIGGFFTVIFNQSDEISVTVEMYENLFDYFDVSVRRDTLRIVRNRHYRGTGIEFGSYRPRLYITAPYLTSINLSGSVTTEDWDAIETQSLSINISGFTQLSAPIDVDNLSINSSGSSTLELWGNASDVNINASGFTNIMATDLQTSDVSIQGSGSIRAEIAVSNSIDARLSGFADIRYIGDPTVTQRTSGSARVRRAE